MQPFNLVIHANAPALSRLGAGAIADLTREAIKVAFYRDNLTLEQLAANQRVIDISTACCTSAATSDHQYFAAAFADDRFAGYVIATVHAPGDHELDWLMVHPDFHGSGVGAALMHVGMAWLGTGKPMWLNVIRHNERAIRFYRRFGFEIDPHATTAHAVPNWVMRRPAGRAPRP